MIDDIILNKKESIERCVRQINIYYKQETGLSFEQDHLKQDAIAINIQRAAEQCIDLANHVVRIQKLGIPKESKDGFVMLADAKIIPQDLSGKLIKMVGFRNILVHQYQELEIKIMQDIIENHLEDFIDFTKRVMENSPP
ncbi:MAG: DUF86 domain-containing protein [Leptospirales bacterium]